ncbi:lipoyl(octanoyl) transferase LipB [Tundrisphaera sp. TA3]|uniref:lipoyl(octanoyl) transferase LipB n=1 Tax=Tundrisphaera sp. TA3 TaxID=3435775 RepID=UPI003EB8B91D
MNSTPPLEIYLLGRVDFDEIQQLQRRLVYDLGDGESRGGVLILCEHSPVISVGRSGSRAHILVDDDELRSLRLPVRWVNRGGGCQLHAPGQLAGYLVLPLGQRDLLLQGYLDGLERVLIEVLGEFDLRGSTRPGVPGVFIDQARVASIGVAVKRSIAYHGFTLNVSTFLGPFGLLRDPSADGPIRQTSMESRRQRPTPMAKVREAVIRRVESVFGLERHHLYTHHPSIRRKVGSHDFAPSLG